MKKKVLIILGHSLKKSFCGALADEYERGAKEAGVKIRRINISDLKFDPILHHGYKKIQKLEPDLIKAQKDIKWAEHIVFVYPVWWGGMPALFKGFVDRALLPGFAFHYKESGGVDKLLHGRSARVIFTMGAKPLMYRIAGRLPKKVMNRYILGFVGFKPIRVSVFGPAENAKDKKIKKWLKKVFDLGKKQK